VKPGALSDGQPAPEGYQHVALRGTEVVARTDIVDAVRSALSAGTLYDYAAHHEDARSLTGRGVVYAVPFPNGERVVIRHNRRGGLLAPVTGDRFLPPTRAPRELAVALRLTQAHVPTPEVLAYAVYRAGLFLRRSDVVTREVRHGRDLAMVLGSTDGDERRAALDAAAELIARLSAAGARHHDLNVKNILLAPSEDRTGGFTALVLDVDRVEFRRAGDSRTAELNLARFARSARKWRDLHGARVDEGDLARVGESVRRGVGSRASGARRASTRS
jgi:3-deoxy-D-manno-octulosonic acid kinase